VLGVHAFLYIRTQIHFWCWKQWIYCFKQ